MRTALSVLEEIRCGMIKKQSHKRIQKLESVKIKRKLLGLVTVTTLFHENMPNGNLKQKLRALIRVTFYQPVLKNIRENVTKETSNSVMVVYQDIERKDLIENFDERFLTLSSARAKAALVFSPNLLFLILGTIALVKLRNRSKGYFFYLALLELKKILSSNNSVENLDCTYIFLNEKQYLEGLFALANQVKGGAPISICHGFYRDTGRQIDIRNTNPNNYINPICPIQITMGLAQSETFLKYNGQRVTCYNFGKPSISFTTESGLKQNKDDCPADLLVLDSKELYISNEEMLSNLDAMKSSVFVKKHPDDDTNYGTREIKNLEAFIRQRYTRIFGANSTLILQLGRIGCDIYLHHKSDFLELIPNKCREEFGCFFKILNFDWKIFINKTDKQFYEELDKLILSNRM